MIEIRYDGRKNSQRRVRSAWKVLKNESEMVILSINKREENDVIVIVDRANLLC